MEKNNNQLSFTPDDNIREINRAVMLSWTIIALTFLLSYGVEVIKGTRTVTYFLLFFAVDLVPLLLCLLLFREYESNSKFSWYVVGSYSIMYTFCLLTGSTPLVFTYILPMLSFLVLFHQPRLILVSGLYALAINILAVALRASSGGYTIATSKEAEIQLALIIFCFTGAWVSSRLYNRITENNIEAVRKILEQNSTIEALESDIHVDKLTGLGSRKAYERTAEEISAASEKIGAIFCDVNGLKYRNDNEGHAAGDRLLVSVATVLTDFFRTADCFRLSGDEFVVLIPGIAEDVFNIRAQRFYNAVAMKTPPIAAIGWYYGDDVFECVKNAESRMYKDKSAFYDAYPQYKR